MAAGASSSPTAPSHGSTTAPPNFRQRTTTPYRPISRMPPTMMPRR
ncbi:hypothetical protein ACFQ0B_18285 [Nonomuraea thailandensis]